MNRTEQRAETRKIVENRRIEYEKNLLQVFDDWRTTNLEIGGDMDASILYYNYVEYCRENNKIRTRSAVQWSRLMLAQYPRRKSSRMFYRGIQLRPAPEK